MKVTVTDNTQYQELDWIKLDTGTVVECKSGAKLLIVQGKNKVKGLVFLTGIGNCDLQSYEFQSIDHYLDGDDYVIKSHGKIKEVIV